jgi:hypothetical protein
MRLTFAGVFADAGVLWRANRDLLVRVASVFLFLPLLAVQLFLAYPDLTQMEPEAALRAFWDWYIQNWYWFLAAGTVQVFGQGVLFALLLDPGRPKLDAALGRALRLLPTLWAAAIGVFLIIVAGFFALILPAFYLTGRTLLTGAVVMAERQTNPIAAIADGMRRTRNNGWVLMLVTLSVGFVVMLAGNVLHKAELAAAGMPYADAVFGLMTAAAGAAGGLAQLLLQAAAYRALTSRQGI